MQAPLPTLSDDQAEAWDRLAEQLQGMGVDLHEGTITPQAEGKASVLAVIGKAGSGKTMLLASLTKALTAAGVDVISGDYEGRRRRDRRTLADPCPHQQGGERAAPARRAGDHDPPHPLHPRL